MFKNQFAGASVFDPRDFGAVGDGLAFDTVALQGALERCHDEGGGVVLLTKGIYLTKPLVMKSNVRLHLEAGAVLRGSANPADYLDWQSDMLNMNFSPYNGKYLLVAEGAENIAITGEGTIDGQGLGYYDRSIPGDGFWPIFDKAQRPGRMIFFALCRNVKIEGVMCIDSPAWTFWVLGCEHVLFSNVTIFTNYQAINTDGIDIDCCRDVLIENCNIRTGDDAIIFRAKDRMFQEPRPCEQAVVRNCTLASNCNAIRFSYINDGMIRNVLVENVSIEDSRRGVICQIPLPHQTPETKTVVREIGPVVENLEFRNLRIEAGCPLWFMVSEGTNTRRVGNIRFENLSIVGTTPSTFRGTPEVPLRNLSLTNVGFEMVKGETIRRGDEPQAIASGVQWYHCEAISLRNVKVAGEALDLALPPFAFDGCERVDQSGC